MVKLNKRETEDGITVFEIDMGRTVLCDWCNRDFTDLPDSGGLMFQSKATCPDCVEGIRQSAIDFGEGHLITSECPKGKSFADWIRDDIRKP